MYSRLLSSCFVVLMAGPAFAQAAPQRPASASQAPATDPGWWRSAGFRKEIGLTNDQSTRIDHIWQSVLPELREEWGQLDEREVKLSRLIQANADEAEIARQIDKVEAMRSMLNKDRQLMLVHMRQVLTPEQRLKFNDHWVQYREAEQQQQQQPRRPSSQHSSSPSAGQSPRPAQPPSSATPTKRPE
jgi:Spy/CpxP family protein refolding chaperone